MGYGGTTNPMLLAAIRRAPKQIQPELLATAWVESGGRLDAVGDNGQSFGPYQEYTGGRGAGIAPKDRMDPVGATQRASREFMQYYRKGERGGQLAVDAQRPADRASYVAKVNSYLDDARRVLNQGGGTASPALPHQAGANGNGPTAGAAGPDLREGVALGLMNRKPGESLFHTVIQAAMAFQGAPATSLRQGITQNPQGAAGIESALSGKGPVGAAKRYLGTPYSWGGGTPSGPSRGFAQGANTVGFDCSSLVQMAWSKMGVNLPRTTYGQIKAGHAVNAHDPSSWRPGDLLFPSTHHVQMYVGNGKVIEAPQTGGHVQIVPVRSSGYIAVRRPA